MSEFNVTFNKNCEDVLENVVMAVIEEYFVNHPAKLLPTDVLEAGINNYLAAHPVEGITEEDVNEFIQAYITAHPTNINAEEVQAMVNEAVASLDIQGAKGEKGDTGEKGEKGDKGDTGADGKSAYEIAVENGFEGTETEWLASLKGEKGDTGDSGVESQVTISDTTITTYTINPNTLYVFPRLSELELTFNTSLEDETKVKDYHFTITNGSTACELLLPDEVIGIPDDFELKANSIAEISIVNGLLAWQSWDMGE